MINISSEHSNTMTLMDHLLGKKIILHYSLLMHCSKINIIQAGLYSVFKFWFEKIIRKFSWSSNNVMGPGTRPMYWVEGKVVLSTADSGL